jgi:hypothetical protein
VGLPAIRLSIGTKSWASLRSAYESFHPLSYITRLLAGASGFLDKLYPSREAPTHLPATAAMSSSIDHVPEHTPIATTALVQEVSYRRKAPNNEVDEKKTRSSSSIDSQNRRPVDPAVNGETNVLAAKEEEEIEKQKAKRAILWRKIRPFVLSGLALLILGWWISATVLPGTRNRWYVPLAGAYVGVRLS